MKTALVVFAFVLFGGLNLFLGLGTGAWLAKREYHREEVERLNGIRRMAKATMRRFSYPVLDTHDLAETMDDYPGAVN